MVTLRTVLSLSVTITNRARATSRASGVYWQQRGYQNLRNSTCGASAVVIMGIPSLPRGAVVDLN